MLHSALKTVRSLFAIALLPLLFACNPDDLDPNIPPFIVNPVAAFALQGNDVPITLTVLNLPDSVTCFSGAVVLTATDNAYKFEGTVPQNLLDLGHNPIDCEATNALGSFAMNSGSIFVFATGSLPEITGVYSVTFADGDGLTTINETLIISSSNVQGAVYSLADGSTLPTGLSINEDTGNLQGSVDVTGQQVYNIVVTATTVAGSGDTGTITITIDDSSAI